MPSACIEHLLLRVFSFTNHWHITVDHDIENVNRWAKKNTPPPKFDQSFSPEPLNKSLKSHVRLLLDCDLHYLQGHWSPALVSISNKVVFFIFSNLWRILNFYGTKKKKEIHSDSAAMGNVIKYVGAKEKVSSTVEYVNLLVKHNGSKSIGDRYILNI